MIQQGVKEPEVWVPAGRLLPILERYRDMRDTLSWGTQKRWALLRNGDQDYVSLDVVDRMLIEMGLEEWLRYPAEAGGLADIYFDGKQYGKPIRSRRKFNTDSERAQAERERRRIRDRKRRAIKVELRCPACGGPRLVSVEYVRKKMKPDSVCKSCCNKEKAELRRAA